MFSFIENVAKAAVGVASLPVALAADVVTMGGVLTDREQPYVASTAEKVIENLEKAAE